MWICEKGGNCVDPCDERCGHYIEVEPVVHGKWAELRITGLVRGVNCSECHTTWDAKSNYCPNCGARMDGE